MVDKLHDSVCTCFDLFCVADCQFASHIFELCKGSIQLVFIVAGLRLLELWICQWVQQPQN